MRLKAPVALILLLALVGKSAPAQNKWHGEYFPNVQMITQDGKKVRFYDDVIRGKVVAINFIYTSCQDVCPVDTAALRRVQKLIGAGMGRDVFFYSITLDPKNDTPAVLKRYMKTFDVGPGWTFLTGRPQDISLIQARFGIRPVNPGMLSSHDTRYVLGNEKIARWVKRTPYDNPHVLAHILTRELPTTRKLRDNRTRPSYAQAERVEGMTSGGTVFMTRCSACHSIGGGDNKLGPDLAGITERRSRDWLQRWIKEPDRMRAQKDPATMALLARYGNLQMPNQRLTDGQVRDVIGYLSEETRRQRASLETKKAKPNASHRHH